MPAEPIPPALRALAPDVARRLRLILAGLRAVVAMRFLRNPRLVLFIIPLCARLNRTAARFERLMARLAAGRLPRPRPSRPGRTAPKSPLPIANGWLIRELRHEAVAYASQLEHLLTQPGVAELLAIAPAAGRILAPIRRMLGHRPPPPRQEAATPAPRQEAATPPPRAEPRPAPPPRLVAPPCPRSRWPWISPPAAKPA